MKVKPQAAKRLKHNVRFQALQLLVEIDWHDQYSNVLLNRALSQTELKPVDQGLLVNLVYGSIQHRLTLDFYLEPFIKGKKLEPWIRSLLRMTVYQMLYLERIPDHAAINEAVNIAKLNGHAGLAGLVNGVLRNFRRQELRSLDTVTDPVEALSIQYSVAPWIVALLQKQYDQESLADLLASLNQRPRLTARIQAHPNERDQILAQLTAAGYQVEAGNLSPYAIESLDGRILESPAFQAGRLTIQDESSMLVAPIGQPVAGQRLLDACSAPGGKATHMAYLLEAGHLDALDISQAKLDLVAGHMDRLGLSQQEGLTISLHATNALDFMPPSGTLYDIIYLDAPCSGLGLMRRKPEIKYTKQASDIEALSSLQSQLLDHVASLLKPGGTLVYSTCTLAQAENRDQVKAFLARRPDFQLSPIGAEEVQGASVLAADGMIEVLPQDYLTDGFFIARMIKSA
ncbi:16S rRNA (cytosine(967)-C(5))-methyltransferase RsmB [Abiotrophia defectiva]